MSASPIRWKRRFVHGRVFAASVVARVLLCAFVQAPSGSWPHAAIVERRESVRIAPPVLFALGCLPQVAFRSMSLHDCSMELAVVLAPAVRGGLTRACSCLLVPASCPALGRCAPECALVALGGGRAGLQRCVLDALAQRAAAREARCSRLSFSPCLRDLAVCPDALSHVCVFGPHKEPCFGAAQLGAQFPPEPHFCAAWLRARVPTILSALCHL